MLDLTCPNYQIFIGASDVSKHVTGFSFRHPLAEASTSLIWTGQIEIDTTIENNLGASFFDDEANPNVWLSGLQPIDVYFNGAYWQRFRIKPSGYRYDQLAGQAVIEITDIIGILDSYQPAADAPEFKTGLENRWNELTVALINKQASLMGISVNVQTPPFDNNGIYTVPRTIRGSYIKEAQRMAGERQLWMWSDKEVIKWAKYPQAPQNIAWRKSRKELLNYTRQQGLEPTVTEVTVSGTNEQTDRCQENYPRTYYTYVFANVGTDTVGVVTTQAYQVLSSVVVEDRYPTNGINGGKLSNPVEFDTIIKTKQVIGDPALILFGGQVDASGDVIVNIPDFKGYAIAKLGGKDWWLSYTKNNGTFVFNWRISKLLLQEKEVISYENAPLDSLNASKVLSKITTKSEPWAKYPDFMEQFGSGEWFAVDLRSQRRITERISTKYTYREIQRDDIIVGQGVRLYEIDTIEEITERVYLLKTEQGGLTPTTIYTPLLVPSERTKTTYRKECLNRWEETKEIQVNKGQSKKSLGFLFETKKTVRDVFSIPEIEYRPAPYPVVQKPLLAKVQTQFVGVSPFVQDRAFEAASTLTDNGQLEAYAKWIGSIRWQRYYSREIACGYTSTIGYEPFQGVQAGNGVFIRDRFGISLNNEGDSWQFVEDCIGNKVASIPEIAPPPISFPPLLTSTLNIAAIASQNFIVGIPIAPIPLTAAGGMTPYTFSSVTLPLGLIVSGSQIVGTPSAIATTPVTITVTDNLGATASTAFNIVVAAAPIPIAIVETIRTIETLIVHDVDLAIVKGIPIPLEVNSNINIDVDLSLGGITSRLVSANYSALTNTTFARLINTNYAYDERVVISATLVNANYGELGLATFSRLISKNYSQVNNSTFARLINTNYAALDNSTFARLINANYASINTTTLSWANLTAQQWADLTPEQWSNLQ